MRPLIRPRTEIQASSYLAHAKSIVCTVYPYPLNEKRNDQIDTMAPYIYLLERSTLVCSRIIFVWCFSFFFLSLSTLKLHSWKEMQLQSIDGKHSFVMYARQVFDSVLRNCTFNKRASVIHFRLA